MFDDILSSKTWLYMFNISLIMGVHAYSWLSTFTIDECGEPWLTMKLMLTMVKHVQPCCLWVAIINHSNHGDHY